MSSDEPCRQNRYIVNITPVRVKTGLECGQSRGRYDLGGAVSDASCSDREEVATGQGPRP